MNSSLSKRENQKNWSSSDWSELHRDMLEEITKRLDTHTDILRSRAVCKGWRSSTPFPPLNRHFSSLKLPLSLDLSENPNPKSTGHLLLKQNTIYCLETPNEEATNNCWFVKIEEIQSGKVCVKDPLSSMPVEVCVKDPFSSMPVEDINRGLPKMLNLLDYRVREVCQHYYLQFVGSGKEPISLMFKKVVVGQRNKDCEFVVMTLDFSGELELWKMGEDRWAKIDNGIEELHFIDIAYYKGRFLAVDCRGLIILAIDSCSLDVTQIASPVSSPTDGNAPWYFVESMPGDLFLIHKCIDFELDFPSLIVYQLYEKLNRWLEVQCLGDQVMFLGEDGSFSVSASDFGGCKENCIYFTDICFVSDDFNACPGFDTGLFDMVDKTARPLTSVVGYSKIFWPPPTWLKQTPS